MTDKPKAENEMEGPAAYAPHDETREGTGNFRNQRGQEQPVDKKLAGQASKTEKAREKAKI